MLEDNYLSSIDTERVNTYTTDIDILDGKGIATLMNTVDRDVIQAVSASVDSIGRAIDCVANAFNNGGRLIYIGAGTSGRLGVLDASECPPTFGVDSNMVIGIIAGGDRALRFAIEGAEDSAILAINDLKHINLNVMDVVCAISASGFASYCISGLDYARQIGAKAICLTCNINSRLSLHADIAIELATGPEVLSGSTRLKAGTATKMVLNMISTGAMIKIGKTYKNLMVDLKPSNDKLKDRSIRLVMHALSITRDKAEKIYSMADNNIKLAIVMYKLNCTKDEADEKLKKANSIVSKAIKK